MPKSSLAEEVSEENGEVQQPPFMEEQVGFRNPPPEDQVSVG